MPLQYDPEFAEAVAPTLQKSASLPEAAVHDVATRRARMQALLASPPTLPDDIEQLTHHVPASDGHQVVVYHFRKKGEHREGGGPAIVHTHGGGYIALNAAECSAGHPITVSQTGVQLFTVDYRLAPENPYPTPIEDCWAALKWVNSHAKEFSIDPSRIAVMGESAGGGLAAALALLARDRGLSPPLAKQILVYPMLDDRTVANHAGKLAIWKTEDNITGWTAYLGPDVGSDKVSPYAAPARVESVEGLPPLYLDCPQLDIFVNEDMEYVRRFIAANIPTEFHMYPGLPHAFEGLAPFTQATQRAMANRYRAMSDF